jgi:hypothetical protein
VNWIEGFGDGMADAEALVMVAIDGLDLGGEQDDGDGFCGGVGLEFAKGGEAVHVGHHHVH